LVAVRSRCRYCLRLRQRFELLLTTVDIGQWTSMAGVQFTQAQARKVLDLPEETVRHWRKVLPPLAQRPRRTPLSHGDLVALAVIRLLVRSYGMNVSALAPIADGIFACCDSRPWPALTNCRLQIDGVRAELRPLKSVPTLKSGAVILIPLAPLIDELGQGLLGAERDQTDLRFPLTLQAGGKQ